jgi:hypothetical protein
MLRAAAVVGAVAAEAVAAALAGVAEAVADVVDFKVVVAAEQVALRR